MWGIILGAIGLVGVAILVWRLIGLSADETEEELAGLVAANWDRVKDSIDHP